MVVYSGLWQSGLFRYNNNNNDSDDDNDDGNNDDGNRRRIQNNIRSHNNNNNTRAAAAGGGGGGGEHSNATITGNPLPPPPPTTTTTTTVTSILKTSNNKEEEENGNEQQHDNKCFPLYGSIDMKNKTSVQLDDNDRTVTWGHNDDIDDDPNPNSGFLLPNTHNNTTSSYYSPPNYFNNDDADYFSGFDNNSNNNNNNNMDAGNNNDARSTGTGNDSSVATNNSSNNNTHISTTIDTELPSLTAAFKSAETRPILVYCSIYLILYFLLAIIAYSFVLEDWSIIDSMYFAVATFTTCGYGDKEPTHQASKLFTIVFAIYGVIILGVFIGIFGNYISEAQSHALRKLRKRKQSQILNTLFHETTTTTSNDNDNDNDNNNSPNHTKSESGKRSRSSSRSPIEESGFWRDHITLADDVWTVFRMELPSITLVAVLAWILGIREHWDKTSILYFSIMAATTTGYGDYTPTNQFDKVYCIFFYPLAVAVFGEVLGRIATVYIRRKQRIAETKFLHRTLTMCDIRNMDSNDDGAVDREDFVTFMLVALQKVDRSTIDELREIFDRLDTHGDGLLDAGDLIDLAEENYLPTLERIAKQSENFLSKPIEDILEKEGRLSFSTSSVPSKKHRRFHTVV